MCRLGITIAPRGEMIMKSKMTVNCRNPRMPITTFSYRENLIRTWVCVAGISMGFLCQESDPKAFPSWAHRRREPRDRSNRLLAGFAEFLTKHATQSFLKRLVQAPDMLT